MTSGVPCPACGEATAVFVCASCGSTLPEDLHVSLDDCLSDRDQTASDEDQTWSDHDQTTSDRDQRTADEDQHAADGDFAAGGDESSYRRSVQARERSSRDRQLVATMRDETASARAQTANDRDKAAALRDRGAAGRDELARLHDLDDAADTTLDDALLRAQRDRSRAAADRAKAADDRRRAADDRAEAARDRMEERRNRVDAADAMTAAATDELTSAWTRAFGLAQVSHELERARRLGAKLVVAFLDVDGLKNVNDNHGHLAGDALLRLVGETLRANVRPYDVLVRYGGDEFLCAMPNLTAAEARPRFAKIAAGLASVGTGHSIAFGLAEAESEDTLDDLIGRADNALMTARQSNHN